MIKVWSWGIAALVAAGTVTAVNAHEPAKTASASASLAPTALEAAAVIDAFHAALDHGNEADALALLADDVLIFESGGAERSKAEYAGHHLAADAIFSQATAQTITLRTGRAEDDLAWIATESKTTGTYKDRPINLIGTETMLLRRQNDGWQ
ncbi:MAG: nuclear transport factor 2 family protein, partial [Alphaproteobacteria bacterium]|nr:nuclear transport factor 2 family protein [Alphaproteobacteria bacterium]